MRLLLEVVIVRIGRVYDDINIWGNANYEHSFKCCFGKLSLENEESPYMVS